MNEESVKRPYKIMIGDKITVRRSEYNGNTFYKVEVIKKQYDKTEIRGEKLLKFRKDVDLYDGEEIIVLDFFEDFYKKGKYDTFWTLFITEFSKVEDTRERKNEALTKYQMDISEDRGEYNGTYIEDDDLPF